VLQGFFFNKERNEFMIFDDFSDYDDCEPAGVELPHTPVDSKVLAGLGLSDDSSNKEIMFELARKGLRDKGISKFDNKKVYYDRTKKELETLDELGFTDYILLNWDILNYCHDNDIPVGAGRGSAAGSLVLFLLGVTNIDPIPHDLFFERFVSKSRAKKVFDKRGKEFLVGSLLPDVDSDISYEKRQQVINYIEKVHKGKTAKILTFNTFSSKLCIRECVKYFNNAKEEEAGRISDMIPKMHGKVSLLKDAREENQKFMEWSVDHRETFENALKIQGLNKNSGVHPSGIAICSQSIGDVVPLQKTKDGDLVTAYDMNDVADLMVKFDILGLRTLTIAHKACEKIGINFEDVDENDSSIYETLQNFNYPVGLFQISAETNFRVCQQVKPCNLDELSDVVALARPGALQFTDDYINQKHSPTELNLHDELDKILSWSKNVILYQEQLMQIANKVFGLTLDEAETLRRIVGKKKADQMAEWKDRVYESGANNGISDAICDFYWGALQASADYSFNKSHSFAYANLAAKTVYLKYNYPKEFFLSVLECSEFEPEPLNTINDVNEELSSFGIKLLPPSLFKSGINFQIEGKNIRYGLNSIKGISQKALESLVDFRGCEFNNKYEVFSAAKQCKINISVLSALIQAGTMEEERSSRSRLVLEAQAFNLLTDREKRNFVKIGDRFGYDILNSISEVVTKLVVGDDNRPIMSEKRFGTFKSKFLKYRVIYNENTKHEKFTNWWYENSLLGYSYSYSLRECFEDDYGMLNSLRDASDLSNTDNFKCVCQVKDFFVRISLSGNKYMIVDVSDNTASTKLLLMDNSREDKLTNFLEHSKLKKDDIVVVNATKSDGDSSFINTIKIIDTKILMKLRDIKKK
jgi:DNA polymerase-3 subunit alpha